METETIVRRVRVNRARSPQEAIDATGFRQYTNPEIVDTMPKGEGDEVELVFFKPKFSSFINGFITDDALEREFELQDLVPADPISLAALNEVDLTFADTTPHGTHWKDADGRWCHMSFARFQGGRAEIVGRVESEHRVTVHHGRDWDLMWLIAGIRKRGQGNS